MIIQLPIWTPSKVNCRCYFKFHLFCSGFAVFFESENFYLSQVQKNYNLLFQQCLLWCLRHQPHMSTAWKYNIHSRLLIGHSYIMFFFNSKNSLCIRLMHSKTLLHVLFIHNSGNSVLSFEQYTYRVIGLLFWKNQQF